MLLNRVPALQPAAVEEEAAAAAADLTLNLTLNLLICRESVVEVLLTPPERQRRQRLGLGRQGVRLQRGPGGGGGGRDGGGDGAGAAGHDGNAHRCKRWMDEIIIRAFHMGNFF